MSTPTPESNPVTAGVHAARTDSAGTGELSAHPAGHAHRLLSGVHPWVWLSLLVLACLLPFVNKAFFIDDTLFLRAAEQIQKHPLDFYGFRINWFDYTTPMTEAFENPPLTCYYIAFAASLVGWSELALHLAFLLPALAAAWGTFELAKMYCRRPVVATVIAVSTPAFLVSATSVMCDVMLVTLWVWSVVLFEKGLRWEPRLDNLDQPRRLPNLRDRFYRDCFLLSSGCVAGLAVLTKFPALSLSPLLAAYGLARTRKVGRWLLAPIVPILFALSYELVTRKLYGQGLLLGAAHYASKFRGDAHEALWEKLVVGLGFAGGCFLPALLYMPMVWSRRVVLAGVCAIGACLLVVPRMSAFARFLWSQDGSFKWLPFLYVAVLVVGGAQVLALGVAGLWRQRNAVSGLLLLWIGGVFVFATAVNWTINARSLLPAIPALGILIARQLDRAGPAAREGGFDSGLWPAFPAVVISVILAGADCNLANTYRTAAQNLFAKYHRPGATVWFAGHWGFQYYLEGQGAKALETRSPRLNAGDVIIYPYDSTGLTFFSSDQVRLLENLDRPANSFCATMNYSKGAGYYASVNGPLPFSLGPVAPEHFSVFEVTKNLRSPSAPREP